MMSGAANHPEAKSKPTDGSASPSASPNTASYLPEDGDAGVDPEHIPGTGAASVGVTRLFRQRDARSLNCLALVETLPYFFASKTPSTD